LPWLGKGRSTRIDFSKVTGRSPDFGAASRFWIPTARAVTAQIVTTDETHSSNGSRAAVNRLPEQQAGWVVSEFVMNRIKSKKGLINRSIYAKLTKPLSNA
jgi:hypothetical protein